MKFLRFLFGDHESFTLEHRIFNTISLLCFLIGMFGGTSNIFIGFPLYLTLSAYVYGLIQLAIYFYSRFRMRYKLMLWPSMVLSMLFLSLLWFSNVGSEGAEIFFFFIGLIYYTILTEGAARISVAAFIIADVVFLYVLEYFHPALVVPYKDRDARFIDMVTTAVYSMVLIFIGVSAVMNSVKEDRTRLKKRNESMENELALARTIQIELIPSSSPFPGIAFHYKPLELVGGDFFDLVPFNERGMVGIFVSDVSGHGVPAAFITSMIKTALLQTAPFVNNPAYLLQYLNRTLGGKTGGNFVTAFYGIYDPFSRRLVYANAGHNSPYFIHGGRVEMLDSGNRGYPLAIMTSDDGDGGRADYSNLTITLEEKSKLLLYTDGLTDAVAMDAVRGESGAGKKSGKRVETEDFETSRLKEILLELSDLPCDHYVRSIYEKLVEFRGNDRFEDDICIICLDV